MKIKRFSKVLALASMVSVASVSALGVDAVTDAKYYTAFSTEDEAVQAAVELQSRIAAEGDTLLKNKDNALPLKSTAKVSVFGGRQNNVLGVSKSSGGTSSGSGGVTVCEALTQTGFQVNPTLDEFYQNNTTSIGKETTTFTGRVESSYSFYSDAAIIILSREGGEGSDASRVTSEKTDDDDFEHQALYKDQEGNTYKHYLMLTNEEEALIKYVESSFSKVIVLINSSNAMEIDTLKNDDKISAILNIGRPGEGGLLGLGQILNGTVSPSGSLVDEWMADFTTDPTWYNFGSNNQTGNTNNYYYEDGTLTGSKGTSTYHDSEGYHGVDYEEGIYLGYKYYETVYTEIAEGYITYDKDQPLGSQLVYNDTKLAKSADTIKNANDWWEEAVAYQYGYGLSYTSFSFNIGGVYTDKACKNTLATSGLSDLFKSTAAKAAEVETVYVNVKVTNTGKVAGKKTVQLYATAPYTRGGVEKAAVSLVGFGKTDTLQPGESQYVTIAVNMQDVASYDYKNLSNAVGADGGYVLEAGEYTFRAMESSHYDYNTNVAELSDAYDEYKFTLDKSVELEQDDYSGNAVSNVFSSGTEGYKATAGESTTDILSDKVTEEDMHNIRFNSIRTADLMADGTSGMTILSRGNMVSTFPKAPEDKDRTFSNSVLNYWAYWDTFRVSTEYEIDGNGFESDVVVKEASHDYETDPWYVPSVPTNWTQATGTYEENHMVQNNRTQTKYAMYVSSAAESPIKYYNMVGVDYNDAKWDEFLNQLTYDELCSVVEFGGYSTVDIGSVGKDQTKDTDGPNNLDGTVAWTSEDILAATFNVDLAYEEGVIMGNIALLHGVEGWYGPGADTHRSPFSGRNNEYYSQDGLHAGYMGAAEVQGVQSMGVIPYIKHCLMNDMETDRGTMFVWADEQTIRESGAKQFQIILQEGGCKAAMTGYARLCGLNNTNNYNLGVELYQNQWGSQAYFVTDGYIGWRTRTDLDNMVRTGNQMELYTTPFVEYLSGEWVADATHANGGYVALEVDSATKKTEESATQWYWVRQSAKAILFQVANSAGQHNGYSEMAITGGKLSATQGVTFNGSVGIDSLLTLGSSVSYSATGLPAGLTLNTSTGAISGAATAEGKFMVNVNYTIDGWISKSAMYEITVAPAFAFDKDSDDLTQVKVGDEVLAQITSEVYVAGSNYDTVTYTVKNGTLPEGLVLSETGEISGKATKAGTYTITIGVTAVKVTSSKKGESRTEANDEFVTTIVVAGDGGEVTPEEPVVDPNTAKIEELTKNIEDLQKEINDMKNNSSTTPTQTVTTTANTTPALVVGIVAMVFAIAACGCSVFLIIKKRN